MSDELGTPRLSELPRYPVAGGVAGLSIAATLAWLVGADADALVLDVRAFLGQPWRLVTSALLHVDFVHLAFDVYWVWRFGSSIERRFGHLRTLLFFVLVAATSGAAEMAIFDGGVGLSGVGYGLFGMLFALGGRDPGLPRLEPGVSLLFLGWFLLCIGTTMTGWMAVANVAHAAGFVQGWLVGAALGTSGIRRFAASTGVVGLAVASLLGASVFRPAINRSPTAGRRSAFLGYRALLDGDPQAAVEHLERALALGDDAAWWYDYGRALVEIGRTDEGIVALRRAVELDPSRKHRETLERLTGEPTSPRSEAPSSRPPEP